jgi:UDP-glucose 4-epimerase
MDGLRPAAMDNRPRTSTHPRRFLITGGAGFVGSHLTDQLLEPGTRVTALDDLSTGARANVAHLAGHPGFRLVEGSILDDGLVGQLVRAHDVVVHLAAAVGVERIVARPLASLRTNVEGTSNVLEAAARFGRRTLLASSSEVYGGGAGRPVSEDHPLALHAAADPRSSYAAAKAMGEVRAAALAAERGLPVTVVRLFNTVGPRQLADQGMVLPRFADAALAGEPLVVHGDGRQSRCFTHVLDVVDALRRAVEMPGAVGATLNVGSASETTIVDLARRVRAAAGSRSPIRHVPARAGGADPRRRLPDIGRAREVLGWEPVRGLDAIVEDVLMSRQGESEMARLAS